jgi:hypothetical protein
MMEDLRAKCRKAIITTVTNCLNGPELIVLAGFEIDGNSVLLDCLIDECRKIKKELKNA